MEHSSAAWSLNTEVYNLTRTLILAAIIQTLCWSASFSDSDLPWVLCILYPKKNSFPNPKNWNRKDKGNDLKWKFPNNYLRKLLLMTPFAKVTSIPTWLQCADGSPIWCHDSSFFVTPFGWCRPQWDWNPVLILCQSHQWTKDLLAEIELIDICNLSDTLTLFISFIQSLSADLTSSTTELGFCNNIYAEHWEGKLCIQFSACLILLPKPLVRIGRYE